MPSLQVRDLPEHIYQKLLAEAKARHRSLAQQAVITLSKGLETNEDPKGRRRSLMSRLQARKLQINITNYKSPADLIREGRER